MSILNHPSWREIRPYVLVEEYSRDSGPNGARGRIEIHVPSDVRLARMFLALTMACVRCGRLMHPIRQRDGGGRYYYAASCQSPNNACSKGRAASSEYLAVRRHMETWQREQQPELFS